MKKYFLRAAAGGLVLTLGLLLGGCPQPTDDDNTTKSSDATLKSLELSAGTLSPEFAAETANYTADVPNGTASITITATANHAGATVEGGGQKDLEVGANAVEITVTAEDGTTKKTYALTVSRAGTANEPAVVNAFDLTTLITAPEKGAAPVTAAIDQPQYSGTVVWQTQNGAAFTGATFGAGTVYKAVVTLTVKEGYTFTGVAANSFTYTGATSTTNAADSGIVTIVFPATAVEGGTEPAVVTAFDLTTLVTAPAKDAAPVTTAIDQVQYSGTVAWQTQDGEAFSGAAFGAATVYQAAVTLTAKTGYTFTGVAADSFTHTGATSVANAVNSGVVTIVFPATGDSSAPRQFSSLDEMSTWLNVQETNTAETPYAVALNGVALSSFATGSGTTADSLGALFAAFHGKYVALDLSGCTETEIGNADATAAQNRPDKDKLVSLVLPELVSIGSNIFCYANGLVSVNVSHVGKLGINAFAHCTALTKVDLSGLTTGETLGSSAFNDCTALSSVVLSSAVTRIKSSAFSGCTSLTALELPASVAKIATWAFLNCSGFSTLIINKTDGVVTLESPATGSKEGVFHNTAAALTIYVPDALVETYKTATNWSAIVDKIKGHSALPE